MLTKTIEYFKDLEINLITIVDKREKYSYKFWPAKKGIYFNFFGLFKITLKKSVDEGYGYENNPKPLESFYDFIGTTYNVIDDGKLIIYHKPKVEINFRSSCGHSIKNILF